jgi:hypothetical protein
VSGAQHFDTYDSGLGREQMLRIGNGDVLRFLIIPPLLDEHNKMRRTLVTAMCLAANNPDTVTFLPDLPGQNESCTPLNQCRLSDWQDAVRRAAKSVDATHVISVRSACLLDDAAFGLPRWRYAPVAGDRIVTQMIRAQLAGDKAAGRGTTRADYEQEEASFRLNLGGYQLTQGLLNDLRTAKPSPLSDGRDTSLDGGLGPSLWLRAEPGESDQFSAAIADNWRKWAMA